MSGGSRVTKHICVKHMSSAQETVREYRKDRLCRLGTGYPSQLVTIFCRHRHNYALCSLCVKSQDAQMEMEEM